MTRVVEAFVRRAIQRVHLAMVGGGLVTGRIEMRRALA